jgi:HlyD family secretion protein
MDDPNARRENVTPAQTGHTHTEMKTGMLKGGAATLLAAAAIAAGTSACDTSAADEPVLGLSTAAATVMDITSSVAATGTVEPIRVIDIKSQASGEVREVAVELGDRVERGHLLVRIDPRDVRNAYEQASADLDVARARYTVAKRQLQRTVALRDSQVVTEEEYEGALLENANARASLVKAETNLELAEDRLNDVTVRAPIAGTIVEKTVEEGQIITSAKEVTGGTILLRMADLSEVQVRTLVDETDIGSIRDDLAASIRVEAYPDREFRGRVLQIEPQAVVEQNVTLFAVLTRIRNEEDLLKPGMNADVEIVVGERAEVLALPNAAVKTPDEARQLAQALDLDPELLRAASGGHARIEARQAEGPSEAGTVGGEEVGTAPGQGTETGAGAHAAGPTSELPSMAEIQSMSQDERHRLMQNLSPADRQRMFSQLQRMREREARAERANPARPKPAFVFVETPDGALSLRPITIGLSSWEYTEILAGLEAGDVVIEVPQALVQQSEMLEFMRRRNAVPGISRG